MAQREWPEWWEWEIEITSHLEKRMEDRDFTEFELRDMLGDASGFEPDEEPGRWVIHSRRGSVAWEIIVEPDESDEKLVIVTAYAINLS